MAGPLAPFCIWGGLGSQWGWRHLRHLPSCSLACVLPARIRCRPAVGREPLGPAEVLGTLSRGGGLRLPQVRQQGPPGGLQTCASATPAPQHLGSRPAQPSPCQASPGLGTAGHCLPAELTALGLHTKPRCTRRPDSQLEVSPGTWWPQPTTCLDLPGTAGPSLAEGLPVLISMCSWEAAEPLSQHPPCLFFSLTWRPPCGPLW